MLLKICAVHCSHFLGVILGLPIPGFVAYQQKYGKPDAETREFHSFILKYARPDPDLVKIWFADFAVGPSGLNLGSGKLDWNDLVSENVLVWNDLVSENVLVSYSVFMSCVGKLVCVCELCFCQLGKSAQTFQRDFPN